MSSINVDSPMLWLILIKYMLVYENRPFEFFFKNKPPLKIDFRAIGTQESHPTAWELNVPRARKNLQ